MLSQYRTASGMSGRGEDVVTGGSTVFKVKERQPQALGIVGLTDASGFLELGQKARRQCPWPPCRLPDPDMQQCGTSQDTVRAPSTHFCRRIGPGDQMADSSLLPWLSCALGLPRRGFIIHLLFGGRQMGPVPVGVVKGLSDPLIPLRFPDITTHTPPIITLCKV